MASEDQEGPHDEETSGTENESRSRVFQLIGLAMLTLGISLLDASRNTQTVGAGGLLLEWAETLYGYLPVAAGVLVGIAYRASTRRLVLSAVAITLAMFALEMLPPSDGIPVFATIGEGAPVAGGTGEYTYVPALPPLAGSGSLTIIARSLRGEFQGESMVSTPGGMRSVAWMLSSAYSRISLLVIPLWVMGLVAGALSWMDRRVLFRDPRDETLVYALVGWVLGPASVALALWLLTRIQSAIVLLDASYARLAIPHLILGTLGALGWWSRGRSRG